VLGSRNEAKEIQPFWTWRDKARSAGWSIKGVFEGPQMYGISEAWTTVLLAGSRGGEGDLLCSHGASANSAGMMAFHLSVRT
jgi:hypothetical protein